MSYQIDDQYLFFTEEKKDPEQVQLPFQTIEDLKYQLTRQLDVDFLASTANAVAVRSEQEAKTALSMALQSRKLKQTLEESRVNLTKPHVDYQKAINILVKDMKDKLDEIEHTLQKKIGVWIEKGEDCPFNSVESLSVTDGSLYKQKKWCFEIIDQTQVPQSYYSIDPEAIESEIKNGVRNIPGVRVYELEKLVMRVKN